MCRGELRLLATQRDLRRGRNVDCEEVVLGQVGRVELADAADPRYPAFLGEHTFFLQLLGRSHGIIGAVHFVPLHVGHLRLVAVHIDECGKGAVRARKLLFQPGDLRVLVGDGLFQVRHGALQLGGARGRGLGLFPQLGYQPLVLRKEHIDLLDVAHDPLFHILAGLRTGRGGNKTTLFGPDRPQVLTDPVEGPEEGIDGRILCGHDRFGAALVLLQLAVRPGCLGVFRTGLQEECGGCEGQEVFHGCAVPAIFEGQRSLGRSSCMNGRCS